ncbi:DUF6069 family protein [Gordonia soli]|uniref:Uncharacterized protein n=1 Tax=Gordonia soli NBRC 108243 TaxID=1223545 RepID=M0QMG2_9ACTN|nr:DUF6069 family protein [Gordonia soli]GAC69763.1 hypothetical protein GS4_28_00110 [Gordonia soli NBRC 108243]
MSYRDPRDPRDRNTSRYDAGRPPETRAYSQHDDYSTNQYYDDRYAAQQYPAEQYPPGQYPADRYADDRYTQARGAYEQPKPKRASTMKPNVNPTLFVGGVVMTGVVTGLAAWLVAWIIRTIVERVNEAGKFGVWNPVARDEIWFAVVGFLCALAAAALWYVLQLVTPSPDQFFRWIVGLLVVASVIVPLLLSSEISVGIGTAVMHLVIGLPILALIPAMGHKSTQR